MVISVLVESTNATSKTFGCVADNDISYCATSTHAILGKENITYISPWGQVWAYLPENPPPTLLPCGWQHEFFLSHDLTTVGYCFALWLFHLLNICISSLEAW